MAERLACRDATTTQEAGGRNTRRAAGAARGLRSRIGHARAERTSRRSRRRNTHGRRAAGEWNQWSDDRLMSAPTEARPARGLVDVAGECRTTRADDAERQNAQPGKSGRV